jgi:hypothetical protein
LPYKRAEAPPWWVAVGLFGISSRGAAAAYLYVTLALAGLCAVAGFVFPWAWLGVLMVLASAWYWASIRWNDRHGGWRR